MSHQEPVNVAVIGAWGGIGSVFVNIWLKIKTAL